LPVAAQVLAALRLADDDHQPLSAAVMIENTHNWHGGVAWSLQELQRLSETARSSGLAVHLDRARIFNAATATGADVRAIAAYSDTVSFCLSKGLCCPVAYPKPEDPLVAADRDAIEEAVVARRRRRVSQAYGSVLQPVGAHHQDQGGEG
jgi:threonine aldolase